MTTTPERTSFQGWVLRMTTKGAGIDAAPGQLTAKERREADQLVAEGLLVKASNHTRDKYGMYIAAPPPV